MFKYLLVITLFLLSSLEVHIALAQSNNVSGVIVYEQKINRINTPAVAFDTLRFNRTTSIFEWDLYPTYKNALQEAKEKYPNAEVVESPSTVTDDKGQIVLLNIAKDSMFSRMNMRKINKLLYLKAKAPTIHWNITDSTKIIGNFTTQKATANFRGRDYTVWFTPEIPVPYGPWKLHGLPGLILQAYDQSGRVYFTVVDIAFTDVGSIGPVPLTGEEQAITLEKYEEIMNNFRKIMKRDLLKTVRPYFSSEDFAEMTVEMPDIKLIETFDKK